MVFGGMSYLAILIAGVAGFVFGAIYYTVLAKYWMAAIGKTEADMQVERKKPLPYIIAIVSQILMAWVLAGLMGHLGDGQVTLRNGVISAIFVWFGFIATSMAVNHAFQGQKARLSVIDGGHWLGVLIVQGAVIGAMGV